MARREPTIHKPELAVACPACGSVPGAWCYGKRGQRMKGVHPERAELYDQRDNTTEEPTR
ncbi:zinc finger domain-containing protein [Streptomyces sp. NPDC055078]